MGTFGQDLATRGDDALLTLLRARPDLATPPPASMAALAARASARASTVRALALCSAAQLQVLDALLAIDQPGRDGGVSGVPARAVVAAIAGHDAPPGDVTAIEADLARLRDLALLWNENHAAASAAPDSPAGDTAAAGTRRVTPSPQSESRWLVAPGVADVAGPYAAGLAPVDHGGDPMEQTPLPHGAPAAAAAIVAAMSWGPPIARIPTTPAGREGAQWLIAHHIADPLGADELVLRRSFALAVREGRTHRGREHEPEFTATIVAADAATTAAMEAALSAAAALRSLDALLGTLHAVPARLLRSGGIGLRDFTRLTEAAGADAARTGLLIELASALGLVRPVASGDHRVIAVTDRWEPWRASDEAQRWVQLCVTWLDLPRAAWLTATADDAGRPRHALTTELQRPWLPRLRRDIVADIASGARHEVQPTAAAPQSPHSRSAASRQDSRRKDSQEPASGQPGPAVLAPSAGTILARYAWRHPRQPDRGEAIVDTIGEAIYLGVLAPIGSDGTLAPVATQLAAAGNLAAATSALTKSLPPATATVLLQGDLTGIVPGRPTPELAMLLEGMASVESSGAALTVRFSAESITRALDNGIRGHELLGSLRAVSATALPQALEYLINDTVRRHGAVRVGAVRSYVRTADPAAALALALDPGLAAAGIIRLADGVLGSHLAAAELAELIRAAGVACVLEAPDGSAIAVDRSDQRAAEPSASPAVPDDRQSGFRFGGDDAPSDAALRTLVSRLRAGSGRGGAAGTGTDEPSAALGILREAIATRSDVQIDIATPSGLTERRIVTPVSAEGGRVRVRDAARDTELTVMVHRIVSVTRIESSGPVNPAPGR